MTHEVGESVASVDSGKVAHSSQSSVLAFQVTCIPQIKSTKHTTQEKYIYLILLYYLILQL